MKKTRTFDNEVILDSQADKDRDYARFCTITSTKEQREKFNIGGLYINGLVCKKCNTFIRSKNRNDFKRCKCGSCAIDGGSWYSRALGNEDDYVRVMIPFEDN